MTKMNDWDEELAALAAEVNALTTKHYKTRIKQSRGLIARKIATIQSQLKIEKSIKRLKSLCEREFLLLPREKALLHWSGIFTEKVENYYKLKQENLIKSLWLKLIRTRVNGSEQSPFTNFDQDDLISLSVRHANFAKTEKYLGELLIKKSEQKAEAVKKYQELTIAQINRSSANTLQGRLGRDLKHALKNPLMKTLGRALVEMTSSLHSQELNEERHAANSRLEKRSDSVLAVCRKFVLAGKSDPTWTPSSKALDRIEQVISKLNSIEESTQNSFNHRNSIKIPNAHPKFVHIPLKEAKTISLD
jgi:hypothetical protein